MNGEKDRVGVENLPEADGLLSSDFLHVLHPSDSQTSSLLLSFKAQASALSCLFATKSDLEKLASDVDKVLKRMSSFLKKFPTKTEIDSAYASKEMKENVLPSLLTVSNMENIVSKYATRQDLDEKEALDRRETIKMAEEMTDFAGAAMVGINQSAAVPAETSGTT